MPEERTGHTAAYAKEEADRKILNALVANPDGLTFTEWLRLSRVHRSTLADKKPKLIKDGLVKKTGRIYKLTDKAGFRGLQKVLLLRHIRESKGSCIRGGGAGGALDPSRDLRIKSTIGYAFPASSLGYPDMVDFLDIKNLVHTEFVAYWLYRKVCRHEIDPRYLTGELPIDSLQEVLTEKLPKGIQVLAFSIDFDRIRDLINQSYVSEILNTLSEWRERHDDT